MPNDLLKCPPLPRFIAHSTSMRSGAHSYISVTRLFGSVFDAIRTLARMRTERRTVRTATMRLHMTSDPMLKDIGISSGEIDHCVRYGRWCDALAEDEQQSGDGVLTAMREDSENDDGYDN